LTTIGTLADGLLPSTPTAVDFTLPTAFNLAANTRYWIGLSTANGSAALWNWSLDLSGTGVPGEFFANNGGVSPNTLGPYQMRLAALNGASAQVVLFDNLTAPSASADSVDSDGPLYDSFETGSSAVRLSDLKVLLSGGTASSPTAVPALTPLVLVLTGCLILGVAFLAIQRSVASN
jgi:hypothetical protein